MEHFVGFGFVACQQYLSATCATDERKSNLELGPKKGEFSLARVVDAAANFWKHRAEWGATPGPQAQRTIRILSAMGIDWTGAYPATDVLWRLQGDLPKRFTHIVPGLAAWREDVIQRGRTV
jgi:hypothetical protein